ncbi:MAG: AzlC family ABC transporter permease [Christensenellales bacterium]|jgi:predicted branched-subunit amino acid permease
MQGENKGYFLRGIRDGMPIFLGYMAVSFTLGITAKRIGLTVGQATLLSFTMNASAGEYAALGVLAAGEGILTAILMTLVANARYLLMSCALSQKFSEDTPLLHRLAIGYDITDEVFGACMAIQGPLPVAYAYGLIAVAIPGWSIGTALGCALGAVLPGNVMSALSVGLYGMFLAVIVPPARQNRTLAVLIAVSMLSSFAMAALPLFKAISPGIRTILLTVLIAGFAAWRFPVREEKP